MARRISTDNSEAYLSIQYRFEFTQDNLVCHIDAYFPLKRERDIKTHVYPNNSGLGIHVYKDVYEEFQRIETALFEALIAETLGERYYNPLTRHLASHEILHTGEYFFSFTYFG